MKATIRWLFSYGEPILVITFIILALGFIFWSLVHLHFWISLGFFMGIPVCFLIAWGLQRLSDWAHNTVPNSRST